MAATRARKDSLDPDFQSEGPDEGATALNRRDADDQPGRSPRQVSRIRRVPIFKFILYYVVIVGIAVLLSRLLPIAHRAFVAPITGPMVERTGDLLGGISRPAEETYASPLDRSIITAFAIAGAFALAIPVAWVAMFTRRLRYDPSLVHSIVILPIVVAGIVILVKNSLALAFSLAGIVAVVRFRNTLKDPKDAVYVFLALGVGLAAGVQALDVALLVSFTFNLLVLGFWKFDVGGLYSAAGQRGLLTIGEPSFLPLSGLRESRRVRQQAQELAGEMETDGYLLVVAADAVAARRCVEISLTEWATDWHVGEPRAATDGLSSFLVAVDLRDKASPVDVLGELDERWPEQIVAAEYLPFRRVATSDES